MDGLVPGGGGGALLGQAVSRATLAANMMVSLRIGTLQRCFGASIPGPWTGGEHLRYIRRSNPLERSLPRPAQAAGDAAGLGSGDAVTSVAVPPVPVPVPPAADPVPSVPAPVVGFPTDAAPAWRTSCFAFSISAW